jgi:hypothetical protein
MTTLRLWSAASLAVAGFAATTALEPRALAEARHPPVVVELRQCEQPLEAEVRRIVGVELRAAAIDAADARDAVTRVVATCHGSEVDLSLDDAITAKRLERTVALAEAAPTARPRLVALAVAELVVASWQEIQRGSEVTGKAVPPGEPPPKAHVTEGARAGQASAMAEVIGVVRAFPGSGLWLLGAGARGFLTLSRPFTLTLDLTVEWGRTSRTTGQVAAQAIGGALGVGWAAERESVFIMPWVGVRAGVARLTGEPSPDSTATAGEKQSGPCLGPELGVAATFFPHATVHATVALSAGAMLLGVRGEVVGDTNVNALGPWAGMVIGVGLTKP